MRRVLVLFLAAVVAALILVPLWAATGFDGGISLGDDEVWSGSHRIRLFHLVCTSGSGGTFVIKTDGCEGPTIIAGSVGAAPDTVSFQMSGHQLFNVCAETVPASCVVIAFGN